MKRISLLLLSLSASSAAAEASSSSALQCQACSTATTELLKSVPVLKRTTGVREGDKEMALADAMPNFCSSYVFSGLAEAAALAEACKSFLAEHNKGSAVEALLVAGSAPAAVCESACAGVPEQERSPKQAEARQPAAKKAAGGSSSKAGAAGAARKGTVDDPAYKAALKKKAERDARRGASKRGRPAGSSSSSEGEAEADL
jgi:hypothetical protein